MPHGTPTPRRRAGRFTVAALGLSLWAIGARADAPTPTPPALDSDETYDTAKQLFDTFAPQDIKDQYDFPSREQFKAFAGTLQAAMDGDSMEELARHEPEARQLLSVLRASPETADYADWLAARLDELHVAQTLTEAGAPAPTRLPIPNIVPNVEKADEIPYYEVWYRRLHQRPTPSGAASLMPRLRAAFAAEGAPPDLAWLAEVESSLNPNAHNPSGARGLYQLKAETAKGLGLSTFLPDERTDPEKSAHAAARLLRSLKERFGSWPLAIAAYNAGEGRVRRALGGRRGESYADIVSSLPAGTRLYVPEVCALVAVRTGHKLE